MILDSTGHVESKMDEDMWSALEQTVMFSEMNSDFVSSRIQGWDVFRLSGPYPPFLSMMLVYDKVQATRRISGGVTWNVLA